MIVHCDSFDIYGEDADNLADAYTTADYFSLVADPDGVSTQKCLRGDVNSAANLEHTLATSTDVIGAAARFRIAVKGSTPNTVLFAFKDSGATGVEVHLTGTGQIALYASGALDALTETTITDAAAFSINIWRHVECKLDIASGSFSLRVEGTTLIDETGLSFVGGFATVDSVSALGRATDGLGGYAYMKDYVLWDDAGSENTDFLGAVRVLHLLPNSDIDINWVPSSGASPYYILSLPNPDDGITYVTADDSPPESNIVGIEDAPALMNTVKAVQTYARAGKSDANDARLQVNLLSAGVPVTGEIVDVSQTFTYQFDMHETDPETGATWTPEALANVSLELDRLLGSGFSAPGTGPIQLLGVYTDTWTNATTTTGTTTIDFATDALFTSGGGPVEGDMILLVNTGSGSDATGVYSDFQPTGYTGIHSLLSPSDSGAKVYLRSAYRFMTSSPDTEMVLPLFKSTNGAFFIYWLRGVHSIDILDTAVSTNESTNNNSPNPGSQTPVTDGSWIFCAMTAGYSTGTVDTWTVPAGFDALLQEIEEITGVTYNHKAQIEIWDSWVAADGTVNPGSAGTSGSTQAAQASAMFTLKTAP